MIFNGSHTCYLYAGSCAGLGFDGCCEPTIDQNCHGTDGICYCDKVCYNFGDCCNDVEEIQCFNGKLTDIIAV